LSSLFIVFVWAVAASRVAAETALEVIGGGEYQKRSLIVKIFGSKSARSLVDRFGVVGHWFGWAI
jgi:hypothetical protein